MTKQDDKRVGELLPCPIKLIAVTTKGYDGYYNLLAGEEGYAIALLHPQFVKYFKQIIDEWNTCAVTEQAVCDCCGGTGTPVSGLPCICGGVGTQAAELQGFREYAYNLTWAKSLSFVMEQAVSKALRFIPYEIMNLNGHHEKMAKAQDIQKAIRKAFNPAGVKE